MHADSAMLPIGIRVIKRDGNTVPFDAEKIRVALANAYLKDHLGQFWVPGKTVLSQAERHQIDATTESVRDAVSRKPNAAVHIEEIQDLVEQELMRRGGHRVARGYVLYRAARARRRIGDLVRPEEQRGGVLLADGDVVHRSDIAAMVQESCGGLDGFVAGPVVDAAFGALYQGMERCEMREALLFGARAMMETDPVYGTAAARLLLDDLREQVFGFPVAQADVRPTDLYHFPLFVMLGVERGALDKRMAGFDHNRLAAALVAERDLAFNYIGLRTLADRYLLREGERLVELPQWLFMRVAMGLALEETQRDDRALEFYRVLSGFEYMCSSPTLFNAGTTRPQLSSCFLSTIPDDLEGIYDAVKENALLAKYAGGLGNDWTPVRALGAHIKGTNGKSQGLVPFLKVANDTAVAVNQGGKRKGAVCAYLETWHLDIEEFLELRKNVGDDRRRTHDMNTANWIPDLFMKRVIERGEWTLFSPNEVPELHETYGMAFDAAYAKCEARAACGALRQWRKVPALDLWRKMLTMLFETGHPWIAFKDPCNIRSPQSHVGVVHCSNLCTEITLNTSAEEVAVCNLGSINLPAHMDPAGALDDDKLGRTIRTAMRMLDNAIDLNLYTVDKARSANLRHRPVGLGMMGFQDMLHMRGLPYGSREAVDMADSSAEQLCFHAYMASTELAEERGPYASFTGSLWDKGVLPIDSVAMLRRERGAAFLDVDATEGRCDWPALRGRIARFGMRNSNCVAIAPTATIANIVGVSPSTEPSYKLLYVKSNMGGEFTEVNPHLVRELKGLGLWDAVMVSDLKYHDGSVAAIARVPAPLKRLYATAFEVDPVWLVEAAARRQKWIDQSQSLNIYLGTVSGRKLDEVYRLAWMRGLKTTYYLRVLGASHVEKSTSAPGRLNAVGAVMATGFDAGLATPGLACAAPGLDVCEACQ